ncbi:MAG TPA: carboxypeptidase regulatory-like domain-containing protein [Gemmatimonadota bacterium]|nr:carboxypeptidase regulatory-like domain-containing protein [Gemmatimonadota bacterium]
MSFLKKTWRSPFLAFAVALPLFAAACADDQGAQPPGQDPPPVTGTISGRVTNASSGAGIVGALVGTSPATTTALTDASGNYSITNIPVPASGSASFAVTASKEGFQSASTSVSLSAAAPTATANLALTPPPPDAPLPTTGNLNVLVTNRSGVAQSGVTVTLHNSTGAQVASATTDANGFVLFSNFAAGSYTVRASTTISGIAFTASAGVQIRAGETAFVQLTLSRDFDQTVFPNIGGNPVTLTVGAEIRLVDADLTDSDTDPTVDCNVIRTQHVFVAEVRDAAGARVSGVKVDWDLNIAEHGTITLECPVNDFVDPSDDVGCSLPTVMGNTGSIIDTDDPELDPSTARSGLSPAFEVDSRRAVTFTNDASETLSLGGQTVTVAAGQTWIVITSPVEGITDVIVSSNDIPTDDPNCAVTAPGVQATDCDKQFAIKRWVNWDISVHEVDWPWAPELVNTDPFDPGPNPNPVAIGPSLIAADLSPAIEDGDEVINVLVRSEDICGGELNSNNNNFDTRDDIPGVQCQITRNWTAFIGVVARLRSDSPFNFGRGIMRWDILDDSPDIDFWGEDGGDGNNVGSENRNAENNGPTDNEYIVFTGSPFNRNRADIEFDANNNLFDGGILNLLPTEDEDDFIGWGIVEVRLDPTIYWCHDVDGDGDCQPVSSADTFSTAYQRLLAGTVDNRNTIRVQFRDIFGEVCGELTFTKIWLSSRLIIIKNTPDATLQTVEGRSVKTHTVQVGQTFSYTVSAISVGDIASENVRITDTLPRFGDQFSGPPDLGAPAERNGQQAFRFERDRPTFDPRAIVYAIDDDNDDAGDTIDRCFRGDDGSTVGNAYVVPPACFGITTDFGTVEATRTAAIGASVTDGHQVVWIQWFDDRIVRGGEAEDSVEIFLSAPSGYYGVFGRPSPGNLAIWCNIATVTDGADNLLRDDRFESFDADTLCHRLVIALLDVRKTANDAVVGAGDTTSFTVAVSNGGSATLTNVVIADTLDAAFGAIDVDSVTVHRAGAVLSPVTTLADGRQVFTVTIPSLAPTAGAFVNVFTVHVRTPTTSGVFCNRVTARATTGGGQALVETDLACLTTVLVIEMDITNEDGFIDAGGVFQTAKEFFTVGEDGEDFVFQVIITNQSPNLTATGVKVVDQVAPNTGRFSFQAFRTGFPTKGSTSAVSGNGFTWTIGPLGPGESAEVQFFALANFAGDDVNRVRLTVDQLTGEIINEETTTISN